MRYKSIIIAGSLAAMAILGAGMRIHSAIVPNTDIRDLDAKLLKLESAFHHGPTVNGQFKSYDEIVKARKKAVRQAGCEDYSSWHVQELGASFGRNLVIKTAIKCRFSNWTRLDNGELVPYGFLPSIFNKYGREKPYTSGYFR